MPVREMVEDELILALPYAPRHESCAPRGAGQGERGSSPFGRLRGLMRDEH
jgi:uncharacterized protein